MRTEGTWQVRLAVPADYQAVRDMAVMNWQESCPDREWSEDRMRATFQDEGAVFRFDGSDQMPGAVGSNAYWAQATNWITGQDTKKTVDNIEKAWPKG